MKVLSLFLVLIPLGFSFGQKKNNTNPIKVVNSNDEPVGCSIYKCTNCTNDRVEIGTTDANGYADIGSDCLTGEKFEFKPNDPNYNGTTKICSVKERKIILLTDSEMANLVWNASFPSDSNNGYAIAAMASLELSGILRYEDPMAADTLRRNVYRFSARWLKINDPIITDSLGRFQLSRDFIAKLNDFQKDNGIDVDYVESTTLSKMATIPTWSIYKEKILRKNERDEM
jgi:hypothetical protein